MNPLINKLHTEFILNDYRWRRNGSTFTPTKEDLKEVLDNLAEACKDEGTQAELGRLIVIRQGGKLDVYLHQGEYAH